jgi:FAD/FMN-containing dehydrogenase
MDVVVQPSVPWMSLNEQIKESGLFFPVDPGPSVSHRTRCWECTPHIDDVDRLELAVWSGQAAGEHWSGVTCSKADS